MRLNNLAWRGLAARPLRTALTTLGIALGVAIVAATLVANQASTDAVRRAATELFGRADLRVRAFSETGLTARAVTTMRGLPGVAAAAAVSERRLQLTTLPGPDEQVFSGMLVIGIDPANDRAVRDPHLVSGTFLGGDAANQVLLNAHWASDHHLGIGDQLLLSGAQGSAAPLTIVGLLDDVGFGALGSGAVAVMPRGTIEDQLAGDKSSIVAAPVTSVDLVVEPGQLATVQAGLDRSLDEPFVVETVATATAQLQRAQEGFAGIAFFFGLVALAVGGFLAANTMSMTLRERSREIGLLRAAGTTARQIVGIFGRQALALGLAGSVLGILLGIAVAAGMIGFLRSTRSVLIDGLPLNPLSLLLALGVGLLVTTTAAGVPALLAARVGPLDALRPSRQPGGGLRDRLRWLLVLEVVLLLVGLATYPLARGSASLPAVLLAVAALVAGAAVVSLAVDPIGRVVGRPFQWFFGAEALLGRANLGRDRARSGLTVGALLIGLAAVVALGTVTETARGTAQRWVDSILPGGYGIRLGIAVGAADIGDTLNATEGLRVATPIVEFPAIEVNGSQRTEAAAAGIDPAVYAETGALIFTDGDRTQAFAALNEGGAVLVPAAVAARDGLTVGDSIALGLPGENPTPFRVAGVIAYSVPSASGDGDLLVSLADAKSVFNATDASLWALAPKPGFDAAAFRTAVANTAADLAAQPITAANLAGDLARSLDRLVGLFDALAFMSVLIAALGIVNTLSVSVVERVREIAILRSLGMTVRQVQAMVVAEAAIMGTIGGIAAAGVGLLVAWALVSVGAVSDFGGIAVPWLLLVIVVLLGTGVAALAGIYPARLAARLPIVGSLRHFE